MTTFPAANYISDAARTVAEQKTTLESFLAATKELPGGVVATTLVIATGSITPTRASHFVDTEGAAASDDLTNIATTNHPDGRYLILSAINGSHVVVVKHQAGGAGQMYLNSELDFHLSSSGQWILLQRVGADWREVFRNAGKGSYANKTANEQTSAGAYTIVPRTDDGKLVVIDASGGAVAQALPALGAVGLGFEVSFKKSDSSVNTVTLDANSSETIDGALTYIIYNPNESVTLVAGAASWKVKASSGVGSIMEHTFTVPGAVAVQSGANDFIPGMFFNVRPGYTKKLIGYRAYHPIGGGASANVKLQKGGVDITGFTGITVTNAGVEAAPTPVVLAYADSVALIVNSIAGVPSGLSFTIYVLEYKG